MIRWYSQVVRPTLFSWESEKVHDFTLRQLAWLSRHPSLLRAFPDFLRCEPLPVSVFGLHFPNPVGLAAGMDKRGVALPAWEAMGFGFTELGGITAHPQPGNPQPRMFRAIEEGALVNRMGFNNDGAESMASQLAHWKSRGFWPNHPVGMNLGKSKVTPLEDAAKDYLRSFEAVWKWADFFVVNVSSPNTPNLRQLQDRSALEEILLQLNQANLRRSGEVQASPKPILVKVAPDLSFEALDEIVSLGLSMGLAGIVATNTTITRPETRDESIARVYAETGGLSGRPLRKRSTEVIRHLYRQSRGQLPIVGVGGIFGVDDAWEKVLAGASLIQIYSGLVYEGPGLVKKIVDGLRERLAGQSWHSVVGKQSD